mgnify:FL=1
MNGNGVEVSYDEIKSMSNHPKDFWETDDKYIIYTSNYSPCFYAIITRVSDPDTSSDQYDFEQNYKSLWGELSEYITGISGSNGSVKLEASNAHDSGTGWYGWRFPITQNMFIFGGRFKINGVIEGDKLTLEIGQVISGTFYADSSFDYIKNLPIYDGMIYEIKNAENQMKWLDKDLHPNLTLRIKLETTQTGFDFNTIYYFYKY